MKRYEVTGRPLAHYSILTADLSIGDVIEADLDHDQEELLVNAGALKALPPRKSDKPAAKTDAKEKA